MYQMRKLSERNRFLMNAFEEDVQYPVPEEPNLILM